MNTGTIQEIEKLYKLLAYKDGFKKMLAFKLRVAYHTVDSHWFKRLKGEDFKIPEKHQVRILKYLNMQLEVDKRMVQLDKELEIV